MSDFLDPRIAREVLRRRLNGAEPITETDVKEAHHLASSNPSLDNVSLYSQIKGAYETSPARTEPEDDKVTEADVETARAAAKARPTPQNLARYSSAKREYEAQTEASE